MSELNTYEIGLVTGGWHPYLTHEGDNLPNGMTIEMAMLLFLGSQTT